MSIRTSIALLTCFVVTAVFAGLAIFMPAGAQRPSNLRYEYAVINGSYSPFPADGPTVMTSAVNICYLLSAGCRNEEVKAEIVIGKFLQDERMENNPAARTLVQQRAVENAFARAISKMGSEGWEMVDRPSIEFDLYYTNQQGIQSVREGVRTERQHIWFKRARQ